MSKVIVAGVLWVHGTTILWFAMELSSYLKQLNLKQWNDGYYSENFNNDRTW